MRKSVGPPRGVCKTCGVAADPPSGAPDEGTTGWSGYVPGVAGSSPLRELRRSHRARLAAGVGVVVFVVIVAAVLLITTRNQSPAVSACAPSPCADDGSSLRVYVDSATILPAAAQPQETGTVVQVSLRVSNASQVIRTVNALDFAVRDAAGNTHGLLQVAGPQCGVFEAVQLAPNATLGPKSLCFTTPVGRGAQLTVVWSPGTRAIDIPVTLR